MVADEGGKELTPSPEKPFRLSDYRDGVFQPNGQFTPESIMPPEAIKTWEEDNKKFTDGKTWGNGQGLFFRDTPLVFGRNPRAVDVVIDTDPTPEGYPMNEFGVSRRHFELKPPKNKKIEITDLGSTNGVRIFSREGSKKAELNKTSPHGVLEVGDFTLFGGGEPGPAQLPSGETVTFPKEWSRLVGFRVCEDAKGKIFLVKFNAKSIDDLLSMIGKTRADFPAITFDSQIEKTPEQIAIVESFEAVRQHMQEYREAVKKNHWSPSVLRLLETLLKESKSLADNFYSGDQRHALGKIAEYADGESRKLGEKGERTAYYYAAIDIAQLGMDLYLNRAINITKERQ